jgi:serine/threonine-protein kinase
VPVRALGLAARALRPSGGNLAAVSGEDRRRHQRQTRRGLDTTPTDNIAAIAMTNISRCTRRGIAVRSRGSTMTQLSAGERKLLGLGRYRFGELLSTSFFGPRYKVTVDPASRLSDPPAQHEGEPLLPSIRPRPEVPLSLRLVEADAPNLIELLARSVQAVRDLDHRAILRPLQIVRSSTRLGVVTAYIEGMTLAQLLEDVSMRQASIPPAIVLRIACDVLEGLEAMRAHATGSRRQDWLFGGLTPDSIHIGADGQTRLLDPGLAGAAARQPCWSHEAAALAYTAPEQTGPDATFDAGSDSFSLGVILWEMLTGRPLFGAPTAAQTLENVHRAPIPRVQRHQFVRGEPIAFMLAQAVAQALRRKPAQRFTNYDAFMTALTQSGEVATPSVVSDLVKQALTHESVEELQARIARSRSDTAPPPAQPRRFNVHDLSLPATAKVTPLPAASTAPSIKIVSSKAPALAPDEPIPGVPSWRRRASRIPSRISQKLSAFPVGDLLRRSAESPAALWPMAVAAAAVLGIGIWSLQPSGQRSAASGNAAAPERSAPTHTSVRPDPRTQPDSVATSASAEPRPRAAPQPTATAERAPQPTTTAERVEPKAAATPEPARPQPPAPATMPAANARPHAADADSLADAAHPHLPDARAHTANELRSPPPSAAEYRSFRTPEARAAAGRGAKPAAQTSKRKRSQPAPEHPAVAAPARAAPEPAPRANPPPTKAQRQFIPDDI